MSFNNLKGELVRGGISQSDVASFLGMSLSNLNKKLSEKIPITRDEMFAIQGRYFPQESLDYLFQSDGDVPTDSERARCRVQALADNIANDGTPMDAEKEEIVSDLMESAERCDPAFVNHVLGI